MPRKKKLRNRPHWLYFLLSDGNVIYIGVTQNLKSRMICHKKKTHDLVSVFKYEDRPTAMWAERINILFHRPKYNKEHLRFKKDLNFSSVQDSIILKMPTLLN